MASAAVVTDEELRRRLLDYGENFPITASNRGILLTKLKRLDDQSAKKSPARSRRSVLGFSSSDDSESERGGAGGGGGSDDNSTFSTPSSAGVRKTRRSRASDVHSSSSVRRRSTATVQPNSSGESCTTPTSVGRSPVDRHTPASSKVTRSTRSSTATSASLTSLSRRGLPAASTPLASTRPSNLDISDSDVSDSSISNIPENRDVNEFPRSRRSMYADWGPSTKPSSFRGTASGSSSSGLRWSTSPRALNGNHDTIAAGELLVPQDGMNSESPENHTNSSQCVSMVLLVVFSLFFLIVSVIYLGARHRDLVPYFAIDSEKVNVDAVCNTNYGESCIAVDIATNLKSTLRSLAGEAECSGRSDNPINRRMPMEEAQRRVFSLDSSQTVRMSEVLMVFTKNPLWGIRLLKEDGTAILNTEFSRVRWLESAVSNVPIFCRLKLAFLNTVFRSAVILLGFCGLVLLGYASYLFVEWKRQEREEVFALVEKILDILQDHVRACRSDPKLTPYLAIPHVRDMLIPPIARKSGRRIFDMAIRFIQNNESRVRFETRVVEGETFKVLRWVQPDSHSLSGGKSSGNKSQRIWQGQAFETLDSGMNALPCSPTPCLKVRNMFDPDVEYEDDWPFHIKDAILEKCIEADIVHLRVDSSSNEGCVYIKCKDSATAGKVYRDLHGWWFDGKLVTVKYLRLERYHERFPEAASCFRFLRPNAAMSSMRMRSRTATFATTPS